jgi:hypothetical protein
MARPFDAAMPSPSIYISIGRNVGEAPLLESLWIEFQKRLIRIAETVGTVVFRGEGPGVYDVDEDAFTVIVAAAEAFDEVELNADLADLAEAFGQDAIAVAIAVPKFVGPVTRRVLRPESGTSA